MKGGFGGSPHGPPANSAGTRTASLLVFGSDNSSVITDK